ncbi:MAG: ABC transporter substrate-binding protein, partial [Actinomycetota bacterium]
ARVRQAIACAVDRQEVVDSAALGEGEVTGPMTLPAYESEPTAGLPCDPPDPEAAKRLLRQAGEADGFSLDTIVMTKGYATSVDEAQSLKAQLSKIGVDLELELLENSVYIDRWLGTKFDAAVALNGGISDPHLMYARYFTSEGSLNSVAAYSSPRTEELISQGMAQTELEARQQTYGQLSAELVESAPWVWLFTGYEYRVTQGNVEGFKAPTGSGLQYLDQTKLTG